MPKVKIIEAPPVQLNRSARWLFAKSYVQARREVVENGIKVQRTVVR